MPIGWDDLGVYMNFPKIMATTGNLLQWAGMYAWQLITGTGFLFSYTAAQAFYINQLGGILAVIAIISTLSYAFEEKGKKSLLSLPVLFAAVYYAMPMTVFQQAKDMKLDPAYLFFSISGIMLLFHVWNGFENKKRDYILLAIIGVIIGFTFSVKFTSVMLVLGCLGFIAYRLLSFAGYLWFFFLFIAFFTKFNLWSIMNVPMPKDNPGLLTGASLILGGIGIACILISLSRHNKHRNHNNSQDSKTPWALFTSWIISSLVFLVGISVGISPWLVKNIHEIGLSHLRETSIMTLLNGSWGMTTYPYEWLYTKEELAIKKSAQIESMTKDGKSQNEDTGRYFGYEEGLNNYLKLPANLTDITYIFLALLPWLFLFVRGKRSYTMIMWAGVLICFLAYYYFIKSSQEVIGSFFWGFSLIFEPGNWKSYGYLILIAINLGILSVVEFATAPTESNKKLREVMMFMGVYAFLFAIAGFGIVWYGIVVYFGFFLIMGYSAITFTHIGDDDDEERKSLYLTLATILFIFIAVYFVRSAFPHGWNNLRSAYYNEYKYNTLSQEESIFAYRSDYLIPIATLNLKDTSQVYTGLKEKMQSKEMKDFFTNNDVKSIPLDSLHGFIMKYHDAKDPALRSDVRKLGETIYSNILYPPKDNQNMWGIYRIGTFMTYLINENRRRYLEDSLILTFNDYFYDSSPEKTIDRMKQVWLKYLLVDLNAATIDRDPRHALTDRAEKLLLTMNASNLRLVDTDNFCLEIALSEKKKWKLTTNEEFIDIAGTNFESYRWGNTIYRGQKLMSCQKYIITIINEKRSEEYPKIQALQNEIIQGGATQDPKKLQSILNKYAWQSWFALFEIIDTPILPSLPVPLTANTQSGSLSSTGTLEKK
jgi:hypothetical protein